MSPANIVGGAVKRVGRAAPGCAHFIYEEVQTGESEHPRQSKQAEGKGSADPHASKPRGEVRRAAADSTMTSPDSFDLAAGLLEASSAAANATGAVPVSAIAPAAPLSPRET